MEEPSEEASKERSEPNKAHSKERSETPVKGNSTASLAASILAKIAAKKKGN